MEKVGYNKALREQVSGFKTVAQQVLEILQPIPNKNWYIGHFTNTIDKCCGLGHLSRLTSSDINNFSYSNCSIYQTKSYLPVEFGNLAYTFAKTSVASINDNTAIIEHKYKQKTPKGRVIALVKDMIKAGL